MLSARLSAREDFGPFDGRLWIDCAQQGPLPRVAARAAAEAVAQKVAPHRVPEADFSGLPQRLKQALAQWIGGRPEDIVLGNSTSYGVQLIANGFPWRQGDEALVVAGDFPASILPWFVAQRQGVAIRRIVPRGPVLTAEQLEAEIGPATRVFCASWVNSFTGASLDIESLGEVCRRRGVRFVMNGAQAIGARTLVVGHAPVDAVACCGYKWLCGPYGTGFCWLREGFLAMLEPGQANWLAMRQGPDLDRMREFEYRTGLGAAAFDVFCTANFLNFAPWCAAVEYLLTQSATAIADYDQMLVRRFLEALDRNRYRILSPEESPSRSTLVVVSHREPQRNPAIHRALAEAGIDVSLREGNLRFSPHLYNTADEMARAAELLNGLDRT